MSFLRIATRVLPCNADEGPGTDLLNSETIDTPVNSSRVFNTDLHNLSTCVAQTVYCRKRALLPLEGIDRDPVCETVPQLVCLKEGPPIHDSLLLPQDPFLGASDENGGMLISVPLRISRRDAMQMVGRAEYNPTLDQVPDLVCNVPMEATIPRVTADFLRPDAESLHGRISGEIEYGPRCWLPSPSTSTNFEQRSRGGMLVPCTSTNFKRRSRDGMLGLSTSTDFEQLSRDCILSPSASRDIEHSSKNLLQSPGTARYFEQRSRDLMKGSNCSVLCEEESLERDSRSLPTFEAEGCQSRKPFRDRMNVDTSLPLEGVTERSSTSETMQTQLRHDNSGNTPDSLFQCEICNKFFKSKRNLRRHSCLHKSRLRTLLENSLRTP